MTMTAKSLPPRPGSRHEQLLQARLYLCTDARTQRGDQRDFVAFLHAALSGGVDVVQLRDPGLDVVDELEYLALARAVTREHGALLAVNDRADLAVAAEADVVHTGQRDLPVARVRALVGPDVVLGRSTQGGGQAAAALADPDVDYFCVGPVWATPTKPGRAAVGIEEVRATATATRGTGAPWFAIGGVDTTSVHDVVAAGAQRVVVVRAITDARDPLAAARELRSALGPLRLDD